MRKRITFCLLAVIIAVFPLANSSMVIPGRAENPDSLLVMSRADGNFITDNLLGDWSPWMSQNGYTRETIPDHSGQDKSVYKCVNVNKGEQTGMFQYVANPTVGTYVMGGYSKALDIRYLDMNLYYSYSIMAEIQYKDGAIFNYHTSFSTGTHGWEYRETSFAIQRPVNYILIRVLVKDPTVGTAWFDDVFLKRGADGSKTYQDLPVQVLRDSRGETTKDTAKTNDGLELGLGDSTVTSVKIGGTDVTSDAFSGFMVRDVDNAAKTGVYAFAPSSGSSPKKFKGNQPDLGLSLTANYTEKDKYIDVSGVIKDTTASQGRAVQLSYSLPVSANGWKWGRDIQLSNDIEGDTLGNVHKEIGGPQMSVTEWDGPILSEFPTSVIYNEDLGLSIAVNINFPSYYNLEYNATTNQYTLNYFLGIVPEVPDAARFNFVIYRTDDPSWGFRSAMKKFTQIYPDAYEVLEKDQGIWINATIVNRVPDPQDFNFKYQRDGGEYAREDPYFESMNGIKGVFYIEPGSWWLSNLPSIDDATVKSTIAAIAAGDKSIKATRQAIANANCLQLDINGNFYWDVSNASFAQNGAHITTNANPRIPGEYNFYTCYLNEELQKKLFDPLVNETVPYDGIYLDELSGWPTGNANFNRAHYQYTSVPLTYSPYYNKPMLHHASTTWEFVKQLNTDLHKQGKIIFANKSPDRYNFYTPYVDAMGTEQTVLNGTQYAPPSIEQLSYFRTLSYQKPFGILFSNDFDIFDTAMMAKYFQRLLAFGIFPSPGDNMGSYGVRYWNNPNLYYNRDREVFKTYMPAIKTVAEAGWEPVTNAAWDNEKILVERYGEDADEGVYYTIYNDNDTIQNVTVDVPVDSFKPSDGCKIRELITKAPVDLSGGSYTVKLQPNQTVVLAIENPKPVNDDSSKGSDVPGGDTSLPNVPTGDPGSLLAMLFSGLIVISIGAIIGMKFMKRGKNV